MLTWLPDRSEPLAALPALFSPTDLSSSSRHRNPRRSRPVVTLGCHSSTHASIRTSIKPPAKDVVATAHEVKAGPKPSKIFAVSLSSVGNNRIKNRLGSSRFLLSSFAARGCRERRLRRRFKSDNASSRLKGHVLAFMGKPRRRRTGL